MSGRMWKVLVKSLAIVLGILACAVPAAAQTLPGGFVYLRDIDPVLGRVTTMAVLEQQRGRAELINELPALMAAVTAESVQAAAATLGRDNRAVLELRPSGGVSS